MVLKTLSLQNFRNYSKSSFDFENTNIIIGKNTIGKTNILEAIYFLSNGGSFRAEKDVDTIQLEKDFAKITGQIENEEDKIGLEVILANNHYFSKKFTVNKIPKRQLDFVSRFPTVLFTPEDIEIITDSPSLRRKYFSNILSQADKKYRHALSTYEKALRQRNRLLSSIKDGKRQYRKEEFSYWNNLLIENGIVITQERENLINYMNDQKKDIFDFVAMYDKSTITAERISKYEEIETKTGVTLIGPQRDDFAFFFKDSQRPVKEFGSRGEERLTILQMKVLEIDFLKEKTGINPLLLLDDIFSELDSDNIEKVLDLINLSQTVITTTHKEFIPKRLLNKVNTIELS